MRNLLTSSKVWKRYATRYLHIFTAILFAATNLSGLSLAKASAQRLEKANQSQSNTDEQEVVEGEILVKLKATARPHLPTNLSPEFTGKASLDKINKSLGAQKFEAILSAKSPGADVKSELGAWYKVSLPDNGKKINAKRDAAAFTALQRLIDRYSADENVEFAQPNYISHATATPNDPYYSSAYNFPGYDDLWGLKKVNAASAWDHTKGSTSVVVAVIDSGINASHPDLAANLWRNTDGSTGWNFINNTNNPADDHGHGTFVAGVMGAVGNNAIGVVGMNWTTRIMSLKTLDSTGSGTNSNSVKALQWAADRGAKVINNSYGCYCTDKLLENAVDYAYDRGAVVVAAAGNGKRDASGNFLGTADAIEFSPANADRAITVGSTAHNDTKASDSNTGPKLDVTAPGVNIISTRGASYCGGDYCINSGTSFAAPHVAGLAALLFARNSTLKPEQVRQLIRSGSIDLGAVGKDDNFGSGRINAYNSMYKVVVGQLPLTPYLNLHSRDVILPGQTNESVYGGTIGSNFSSCKLETGKGRAPASWTLATGPCRNFGGSDGIMGVIDSKTYDGGLYSVRLTATDTSGVSYVYQVYDVKIGNVPNPSAPTVTITSPAMGATVSGTVTVTANLSDANGISKGELYVDGVRLIATDTTAPYQFVWNTTSETNGNHSITVKAYDTLGNTAVAESSVVVSNATPPVADTTKPVVNITSPANYAMVSGIITVTVTATDNVGVQRVELFYGNDLLVGTDTTAPYTFTLNTALLPNGTQGITAIAYDARNNYGSSFRTVYVNN